MSLIFFLRGISRVYCDFHLVFKCQLCNDANRSLCAFQWCTIISYTHANESYLQSYYAMYVYFNGVNLNYL